MYLRIIIFVILIKLHGFDLWYAIYSYPYFRRQELVYHGCCWNQRSPQQTTGSRLWRHGWYLLHIHALCYIMCLLTDKGGFGSEGKNAFKKKIPIIIYRGETLERTTTGWGRIRIAYVCRTNGKWVAGRIRWIII